MDVAVNRSTDRIYVANYDDNTVSVIDGKRNHVIHTINVGDSPSGVDVNRSTDKVYVANSGTHD